ncbi:MAG: PIG-L family deacetylase [Spirochaetia bacterium]|nr:PIG-L family deacetylase [Spirochaetia bacterium]
MDQMLSQLFQAPKLDDAKCVLCVQPHSDDNEIGMGATIKKLADMGCEIHYLTVTDGRLGTEDVNQDLNELVKIRREEAINAAKILGVNNFHFFDYKDGSLKDTRELSYKISELIRTIKSDYVFVCDPNNKYEAHLDHIIVGQAVSQAVLSSSLAYYPEDTKTSPFEVSAIGYYFTSAPNTFIDISNEVSYQFDAMEVHKSQFNDQLLYLFKSYLLNQYKEYAKDSENELSQGLKLLRPLHLHCIIEASNI